MGCFIEIVSACICGSGPKSSVCWWTPSCPEFIKVWKVIRRIRKTAAPTVRVSIRNKKDHLSFFVHHWADSFRSAECRTGLFRMMSNGSENFVCPGFVIIYSGSISPATASKVQRGNKIFFPVGSWRLGIGTPIPLQRPGKVSFGGMGGIANVHVCHRIIPDRVKLHFLI